MLKNLIKSKEKLMKMFNSELPTSNAEFDHMIMTYSCAIRKLKTKLDILNKELSLNRERNPIEFITYRIKTAESIIAKLERRNHPITISSIEENLTDVAGIRVICPFIDDIYEIAEMLKSHNDIKLIEEKDYIKNPKPNGYRSLHLIVEIPLFFSKEQKNVKVEIQIRTIAMNFWASLDSQLKYKKEVENAEEVSKELKECADIISQTDKRMLDIKNSIYANEF